MTTINTNIDETNKILAQEMKMQQELTHCAKQARKSYEDLKAKFISEITANPISAITWHAETMVMAQTNYEIWMQIEQELAEHEPSKVLAENLKEIHHRIRSFFGSNSTSMFSNSVDRAKAEAYVRLVEQFERLIR